MNKWLRKGFIFKPDPSKWWMRTHGMTPSCFEVEEYKYKIYFSGRDDQNRSQIGYFLLDLTHDPKVVEVSTEPVLSPGRLGTFDDNGVTPASVVKNGSDIHLYYIGWNPGTTTRMHIYGGLAISEDNGETFKRWSEAPILERCRANPFINTAPFALKRGPEDWLMYYVSGVEWVHKDLPRYNIQLAKSKDGKEWKRDGHVCIDFEENENALARPFVIFEDGIYKMWFAAKGENYEIKYAESHNGENWIRKPVALIGDKIGDEEMAEYAIILQGQHKKYMLYNGNTYGKEGILIAEESK